MRERNINILNILNRTNFHYCLRKPSNPIEGDMWNDPAHGTVLYTRNRSKLEMFSLEKMEFIRSEEEIREKVRAGKLKEMVSFGIDYEDADLLVDDLF